MVEHLVGRFESQMRLIFICQLFLCLFLNFSRFLSCSFSLHHFRDRNIRLIRRRLWWRDIAWVSVLFYGALVRPNLCSAAFHTHRNLWKVILYRHGNNNFEDGRLFDVHSRPLGDSRNIVVNEDLLVCVPPFNSDLSLPGSYLNTAVNLENLCWIRTCQHLS